MNTAILILLIVLLAVALVCGAAAYAQYRDAKRLAAEKAAAEAALIEARNAQQELTAQKAKAEAEIEFIKQQRVAEAEERKKSEEQLRMQFENLANKIFNDQSQHFKESSKESIDTLLKPFRDNITDFRKRFEDIYTDQTSKSGALKEQLEQLMKLNQSISAEAQSLTNALKGNSKVQGDWGETILNNLLENSGLRQGYEYEIQGNLKDADNNNLRPDVVVHLPGKKEIVIDSKVSLTDYVNYSDAENNVNRKKYLDAHVTSVRKHVNELANKEYQKLLNSPDFVILFIPNEPAFLEALKADATLWNEAYKKGVIISSPINLIAMLKIFGDLWKRDEQDKKAKEIAECGLNLYKKAVGFTDALESVGKELDQAKRVYETAFSRLKGKGGMVSTGERLKRVARLQTDQHFSSALVEGQDEEEPLQLNAEREEEEKQI